MSETLYTALDNIRRVDTAAQHLQTLHPTDADEVAQLLITEATERGLDDDKLFWSDVLHILNG